MARTQEGGASCQCPRLVLAVLMLKPRAPRLPGTVAPETHCVPLFPDPQHHGGLSSFLPFPDVTVSGPGGNDIKHAL